MSDPDRSRQWFPIASATDLAYRTVFHAQLLGREYAAWRADDDYVNVWENRCLHRGLRLSRGINDGAELVCQYHGWRYSNVTAGCTYIPAHPADAPARTICNRVFPAAERYGLIWTGYAATGDVPAVGVLEDGSTLALRPIPVNAPPAMVLDALADYAFLPSESVTAETASAADWRAYTDDLDTNLIVVDRQDHAIMLRSGNGDDPNAATTAVFFVQPLDSARAVIRGVLAAEPGEADRIHVLRHHNDRLSRLRDRVHEAAAALPTPEPMVASFEEVPVELATIPEPAAGRPTELRVRVARKWQTAVDTVGIELTPLEGHLETFQPGAHIDVHLPNGLVRQYSLSNHPGELDRYRIGVKREPESRGGSAALHDTVREGDVLAISAPHNNFTLRRDTLRTVLLAGGIGLTPLLAMAEALDHSELPYELHVFARSADHVAFRELLDELDGHVTEHLELDPPATGRAIRHVVGEHTEASQIYVCGPAPMIQATCDIAAELGWPEDTVHFEYFANPSEIDASGEFEVALARSALTLHVSSGESILDVLRANGVALPSSCEQGACGTCIVPVIEGEPLHQDVYLRPSEHAANDRIATCVSRSTSDRLVLDL